MAKGLKTIWKLIATQVPSLDAALLGNLMWARVAGVGNPAAFDKALKKRCKKKSGRKEFDWKTCSRFDLWLRRVYPDKDELLVSAVARTVCGGPIN